MKHWFIVHSPIAQMVAPRLIEFLNLRESECRYLAARGFGHDDSGIESVDWWFCGFPETKHFGPNVSLWKVRRLLRKCDRWIEQVAGGESYHLYLPNTAALETRILISHPLCAGFSIVEDGASAYFPHPTAGKSIEQTVSLFKSNDLSYHRRGLRGRLSHWLKFGKRVPSVPVFFDPGYAAIYGLHELSFQGFPRRSVIGLPFEKRQYDIAYRHIFILSPLGEAGLVPWTAYLEMVERLMDFLIAQGAKELHIKYHPVQRVRVRFRERLTKLFDSYQSKLKISVIADSESLERIAASQPGAVFYTTGSSCDIYAAVSGCKVVCISPWLIDAGVDPEFVHSMYSENHRNLLTWV